MAGLRAFEVTARHLSFTRAATELNITQGAVSHQIRNLEDIVGVKLFEREGNNIRLTDVGFEYLASARAVITEVLVATDRATDRRRGDILTVACLGTFSLKCLIPSIHAFIALHPAIGLRVRTLVPSLQVPPNDYDISIQYGQREDWPDMVVTTICGEELFPVCSPALLHREPRLKVPVDLSRQTIIRTASPLVLRDDWPLWLEMAGVPRMRFAAEMTCDLLYPSYQAAIEGLGVVIGRSAVVKNDVESGRLVEPFSIRLPSPLGYHLVVSRKRARLAKVQAFCDWVVDRLGHFGHVPPRGGATEYDT